jgi:hypothetical protein
MAGAEPTLRELIGRVRRSHRAAWQDRFRPRCGLEPGYCLGDGAVVGVMDVTDETADRAGRLHRRRDQLCRGGNELGVVRGDLPVR